MLAIKPIVPGDGTLRSIRCGSFHEYQVKKDERGEGMKLLNFRAREPRPYLDKNKQALNSPECFRVNIQGEPTVKIDNTSGSFYNQIKIKTRR